MSIRNDNETMHIDTWKGIYAQGWKWCKRCRRYWKTDGYRCPYCNSLVRQHARGKGHRLENMQSPQTQNNE